MENLSHPAYDVDVDGQLPELDRAEALVRLYELRDRFKPHGSTVLREIERDRRSAAERLRAAERIEESLKRSRRALRDAYAAAESG